MIEDAGEAKDTSLALSVSTDADGFLRRACPSCGREFKTDVDEADLAGVLAPTVAKVGGQIGSIPFEANKEQPEEKIRCPFCRHRSNASDFLTDDLVAYVRSIVLREIVIPAVNKAFGGLADRFSGSRSESCLSIRFEHDSEVRPPRPVHGPEPRDMKIVRLLCCDRRFKVPERWYAVTICPYCETDIRVS